MNSKSSEDRRHAGHILAGLVLTLCASSSPAAPGADGVGFEEFLDRNEWFAAVGGSDAVTTLGFAEFAMNTVVTDQYLQAGALFLDGNEIVWHNPGTFPQDGFGAVSADWEMWIQFCEPQRYIAAESPGWTRMAWWYEGEFVGFSSWFMDGYGGVVSDGRFDLVKIWDINLIAIDDIYFGTFPPVPGDTTFDGIVNVDDLIKVIINWGECAVPAAACPAPQCSHADLNDDGKVDVDDLIDVLVSWTTS